ncbi:alpha/beta hydrolase [Thalassomonas actiniarum]|uniref:Alpha/beta fold hydrolase n=1 Tax=Thalassomonas actiniarum TaxID=485447 RepID=A0AAE9YTN3_9GAMM|nr:alpha/beta hydrolase [Thalassomonas actiniarum]WDE00114.1 alpha/beta fold hydrolase [Thalassomonas actiniarum]
MFYRGLFATLFFALGCCAVASAAPLELKDCHLDGIKEKVKCGQLQVPENYAEPEGKGISINFAVLPAIDQSQKKTPLMFLAGGPGQAAVELAAGLRKVFNESRKTRDLILVDQRGTGESKPFQCDLDEQSNIYQLLPEEFSAKDVRECLSGFDGELSQYSSENAIRDFEALRKALGYQQVNLYGGSYGTRAALVYMRLFPEAIRSVVLDSVGPVEIPIGLFGQSTAHSFDLLLANCHQDKSCQQAYPDLKAEFHQVLAVLEQKPQSVTIPHPRLGEATTFVISKSKFIGTLTQQLYSTNTRAFVPLVIHQAAKGNYLPLAGLIAPSDDKQSLYLGLHLNIICNEDFPKITTEALTADADNNFGGDITHHAMLTACPLWPQYRPGNTFYQPVTADIPTLILSGELDPVTPPSNGEFSDQTLANSHHIVVKHTGHTVAMSTCASDIINEFMDVLTPAKLDESCLEDIPGESFMTGLNGSF